MSGSLKRNAIAAITALVMLWPFAHLALAARMRIDPWELFGWAMYSQPPARVQVRVDVERRGDPEGARAAERKPLRAMGALRRRVEAFARARTTLGDFASPAELVGAVFASDASIDAVVLVLRDVRLDLESAYLVASDEALRFERPPRD